MKAETCVACGKIIPEGSQYCHIHMPDGHTGIDIHRLMNSSRIIVKGNKLLAFFKCSERDGYEMRLFRSKLFKVPKLFNRLLDIYFHVQK